MNEREVTVTYKVEDVPLAMRRCRNCGRSDSIRRVIGRNERAECLKLNQPELLASFELSICINCDTLYSLM